MADPITCSSSPGLYMCPDAEPEETLATRATIGPPPDPATQRRLEQAAADARMQQLADGKGGMSTSRGTSAQGKVPMATTVDPTLRKQYEALVAARKHEKPIEFDPYSQAIPTLGLSAALGAAHGAIGVIKHVAEHALWDVVEHQGEEMLHEQKVHTRERNESRDCQPAPVPTMRIRG